MSKILIVGDCATPAIAKLRAQFSESVSHSTKLRPTPEQLTATEALLIRSGTKIDKALLNSAPNLKIVVTATSGFDHIDFVEAKERNIQTHFCPGANAEAAAQHTMALMLNLLRGVPEAAGLLKKHQWRKGLKRGFDLTDLQLGIVGFGRIGSRVASLAKAFGMKVCANDPYVEPEAIEAQGVEPLGLMEVFKTCDVVTFHVPLTNKTRHLINHRTLEHLNPEAFLVNASRGAIFDETELAVRMRKGFLRGAALDVFEREPLSKESPLWDLNNVFLTPHIGAFTEQAFERASLEAAEKIIAYFNSQPVPDPLPPNAPWAQDLI